MLASKILTVHTLILETRRFAFGKIRQVKGYLGAPRSLEFRIRKSVTDPILPPREISDTDRRLAVINRDLKRDQENQYFAYCTRLVRDMFESQSQTALGGPKVVLVCSQLYMKERDHRPARIALFPHRFIFHKHNPLAMRRAVEGTRFGCLLPHLTQYVVFYSGPRETLSTALNCFKQIPYLIPIFGLFEDRILSLEQLHELTRLQKREQLYGAFVGELSTRLVSGATFADQLSSRVGAAALVGSLGRPLSEFSWVLQQMREQKTKP